METEIEAHTPLVLRPQHGTGRPGQRQKACGQTLLNVDEKGAHSKNTDSMNITEEKRSPEASVARDTASMYSRTQVHSQNNLVPHVIQLLRRQAGYPAEP